MLFDFRHTFLKFSDFKEFFFFYFSHFFPEILCSEDESHKTLQYFKKFSAEIHQALKREMLCPLVSIIPLV